MNNWDYHKNEFIKLGGIADNVICREGSNGRGIFRESNSQNPKIACPTHLLIKIQDVDLVDDKFHLRAEAGHSPEVREFIENYYQDFSWECNRREEIKIFIKELSQIPEEAKILLLKNKLCSKNLLICEPSIQHLFLRFASSRCARVDKNTVFAPIWELVNHSSIAEPFKTSKIGIETPTYPLDLMNDEIFHLYQRQASPIGIFFNYGFASNEFFAYSLPTEIKIANSNLLIRISGNQSNFNHKNRRIIFKDDKLLIPALPLGSLSKQLPQVLFYSIVGKYGISELMAADIVYQLQLANLEQRKKFLDILCVRPNITVEALIESIKKEIALIEISLQAVQRKLKTQSEPVELSDEDLDGSAGGNGCGNWISLLGPLLGNLYSRGCSDSRKVGLKNICIQALAIAWFLFLNHVHKPTNQPSIPNTIERSKYYPKSLPLTVSINDADLDLLLMSEEQLKAFLQKVKAAFSLQGKLNAAASPEAAMDIANDEGFLISAEDIQSMQATVELSDEELEGCSWWSRNWNVWNPCKLQSLLTIGAIQLSTG